MLSRRNRAVPCYLYAERAPARWVLGLIAAVKAPLKLPELARSAPARIVAVPARVRRHNPCTDQRMRSDLQY